MKIAVLGAARRPGLEIVAEAEKQGIGVTCVISDASVIPGSGPVIIKDPGELESADFAGCHAVVDALSFPEIGAFSSEELPLWHVLEILKGTQTKVVCLGAASCLYSDESRSERLLESSCVTHADHEQGLRLCATAFKRLASERGTPWTLLCPPLILDPDGQVTGRFEFAGDVLPMALDGSSYISGLDFARAAVELLLRGPKPYEVISVSGMMSSRA